MSAAQTDGLQPRGWSGRTAHIALLVSSGVPLSLCIPCPPFPGKCGTAAELAGKKVACIVSGRNIEFDEYSAAISDLSVPMAAEH